MGFGYDSSIIEGIGFYRIATSMTGAIDNYISMKCLNLFATQLTGTLQTASQPNITSLGVLSSLSVSGTLSAGTFSPTSFMATGGSLPGSGSGVNIRYNGTGFIDCYSNYASLTGAPFQINASSVVIGANNVSNSFPLELGYTSQTIGSATYGYLNQSGASTATTGITNNYSLRCAGRILCSTEIDCYSDKRLKENIMTIDDEVLSNFKKIEPKKYTWKNSQHTQYGYIAQDFLKNDITYPITQIKNLEIEEDTDDEGFISPAGNQLSLNYNAVIPLLHKYIMSLEDRIIELEKKITL